MRKRILILVLALGLVAQSCLQNILLEQAGETPSYTGDGVVVQLTVPSGVSMSNAGITKAGEAASEAESTINSLYIYLYTKSSGSTEWTEIDTIQPDMSELTAGSDGTYTIDVVNTSVTTDFLGTAGNQLLAVVYANSDDGAIPTYISNESDFWSSGSLKPLFFSGSDVFESNTQGGYYAKVELQRQVAKLRVRASISADAIPSDLEIDPASVQISVSNMPNNSDISVGLYDSDPKASAYSYNIQNNISRSASASESTLRSAKNSDGSWEAGLILDSLYMYPTTANSQSNAIKVNLKMTVKDPTARTSANIEKDYYITNSSDGYTTSRNTIYTLDVVVQSIDGTPEVESGVSISDWDDEEISVDVPWGEITIDRTRTVAIKGRLDSSTPENSDWHSFFTVSAGQGYDTYQVSLVDINKTNVVGTSDVRLRVDGTMGETNTVDVKPGSSYKVEVAAGSNFTPCYLKLHKSNGSGGITRYIPVGAAEFDLASKLGSKGSNGFYSYAVDYDGSSDLNFTASVLWPDSSDNELLDLQMKFYSTTAMTTELTDDWVYLSLDGTTYTFVVEANDGHEFGSEVNDYDLSTKNGTESATTANCYIVNAPGTYRFPLVYGNAIKDNQDNTESYRPSVTSATYVLSNFLKHDGSSISSPKISDASEAIVVWQDVDNLVTSPTIVSSAGTINGTSYDYLSFSVNSATIAEGNAVVAVRNSLNQILWSWHIWVTTYDPDDDGTVVIRNNDDVEYRSMDRYLGACSDGGAVPRNAYVAVVPTDLSTDLDPVYIDVSQTAYATVGDNCYFQPGRKDPFPGISPTSTWGSYASKTTYGSNSLHWGTDSNGRGEAPSGFYYNNNTSTAVNYYYSIAYPSTFIIYNPSTSPSYGTVYFNAWDATMTTAWSSSNNNKRVVKTVYDPSPRGFCVPPPGVFTGFAENVTNNMGTMRYVEGITPSADDTYLYLYTTPDNDDYMTFRAVGYRLSNQNGGFYGNYSGQNTRQVTLGTSQVKTFSSDAVPLVMFFVYNGGNNGIVVEWRTNGDWNNARCILPVRESTSSSDEWTYDD